MTNPWLDRRILHFAHQGGAREAPSSTLLALRQSVAAGAHALELDVHATADRHLVVCHDATVDRTTNGTGAIASLRLDQIKALDNAYWWVAGEVVAHDRPDAEYIYRGRAPLDGSLGIATLREVLDEFPDVLLNLDIKQTAPDVAPYEELLATLLREYGRGDDVIVASFHDTATEAFTALAPEITTAYGTNATASFVRAVRNGETPPVPPRAALQVPTAFLGMTIVDRRLVEAAHGHGVAVHVWTIDDPAEMSGLVDLGVDGVMTDRPTVLASVLAGRRAGWAAKG